MKNSTLVLMLVICILLWVLNWCIDSQLKKKNSNETETTSYGEVLESEEESSEEMDFSVASSEEEISYEESSEEVSCEYDSSEESFEEESSEEDGKHLMGCDGNIIKDITVKIYNEHSDSYNLDDAMLYIADVIPLIQKHKPDGMWTSAVMAQAYTEGGAGKSGIYTRTNNMFGIMAGPNWGGYVYSRSTGLVYKNYSTARVYGATGLFRAYSTMEESVIDYMNLIQSEYYEGALKTESPQQYLLYLLNRNYGENYMINTWIQVINKFNLTQYDEESDFDGISESRQKTIY